MMLVGSYACCVRETFQVQVFTDQFVRTHLYVYKQLEKPYAAIMRAKSKKNHFH